MRVEGKVQGEIEGGIHAPETNFATAVSREREALRHILLQPAVARRTRGAGASAPPLAVLVEAWLLRNVVIT